jgi:transposase
MRSIGLDLGSRKIAFCEVRDGQVVARCTVGDVGKLLGVLGPNTAKARVAIEACREAWHMYDQLTAWGHEVWLVDTTRSKQLGIGAHGRKTDRIDAEVLARAVEQQRIPRAHVLSPERRELRNELHARRSLVEARANIVTTIRGMLRAAGVKLGGGAVESLPSKLERVQMPEPLELAVGARTATMCTINEQLPRLETALAQRAARDPVVQLLMTIHGVSLIVAD